MLRVDFSIAPGAQQALEESGKLNSATVAVPITIEKEVLHLLAPPVCSTGDGLKEDLKAIRKLLDNKSVTAAYIVVRSAPSTQYVVLYVSDTASAMSRMLYSTGAAHLVKMTPNAQRRTIKISEISELLPSLFKTPSDTLRDDLMTESERHKVAIAQMDLVPQPVVLPGLDIKLTAPAEHMLSQFASGSVDVVIFKVESGELHLDKSVEQLKGDFDQLTSLLSDSDPRFLLLRYPSPKTQHPEAVMVYVCPPTCSPKVKIQYASSAAAFREEASRHKIKFTHRVETDTPATLIEDVHSAFEPFPSGSVAKAEMQS